MPPSAPRYHNTIEAFYTIYKNEGLSAFYKGLLPSLFGVSHVAIQFGLYEKAKKAWAGRLTAGITADTAHYEGKPLTPTAILVCSAASKMIASCLTYPHEVLRTRIQIQRHKPQGQAPAQAAPTRSPPPRPTSTTHHAVPGTAHLYSPLVTGSNPPFHEGHDPNHSHHRLSRWAPKKGGIIDVFRSIYRQDGWRGFYRGLSINLVRTVPSSAVTMLSYELIMRNLAASSARSAGREAELAAGPEAEAESSLA